MSVFVVGLNGCRLMPVSERKARLLLDVWKVSIYRKVPFTIKLNYKTGSNDATAIALVKTGIPSVKDKEPGLYIQQVRRKKRSLHEETPRKGRKEPNRTDARNSKNKKAVTVTKRQGKEKVSVTACLFDRVELDGKKGWISGFTGTSCYVKDEDDQYLSTSKTYKQVSLSKLRILHHCGNWVIGAKKSLGKG